MSDTAFDSSELFAFVGSDLFARNKVQSSTGYIQRMLSPPSPLVGYDAFQFIFPDSKPLLADSSFQDSDGHPIGQPLAAEIKAGWNRLAFLVWGIDNICNPFDEPAKLALSPPSTIECADDYEEIFLSMVAGPEANISFADDVPLNRQYVSAAGRPPVKRVPLNCRNPELESFTKSLLLFTFTRVVEFSVFGISDTSLGWGGRAGRSTSYNQAYRTTADSALVNVGTLNSDLIDPVNPVLVNGQQLNLFYQQPIGTGLGIAIVSSTPESGHRPVKYTDISMVAVQ